MNKLFIDSDILIDWLAARPQHAAAAALMTLAEERKVFAFTTSLVFANINYIVTKFSNRAKATVALKALRDRLKVIPLDETAVNAALESDFPDFEDALQYFAAEKQGLDYIVTRNKKDYRRGTLPVVTAQEYLDMFEAAGGNSG